MLKKFFIAISSIFIITSCATMPTKEDTAKTAGNNNSSNKEEENSIIRENTAQKKVTVYGADKEVQAVEIDGKTYYVIGGKDVENMSDQEIKSASLSSPLKITEQTVKGNRGIVIVYYDVKIFLGKKGAVGTTVGLFEPQKNDWTLGDDIDRSQSIQIKLSREQVL